MRRLILLGLLAGWVWALPAAAVADTVVVEVKNFLFQPAEVVIFPGDAIDWQNVEGLHSTTSDDRLWDSGVAQAPWDFQVEFDTPGDYPYYCTVHGGPGGVGQAGIVHVVNMTHRPPPVSAPADAVPVTPPTGH
jgi:plastocyanin